MPHALILNQIYKIAQSILTTSNNRYQIAIEGQSKNGLTLNSYLLNFFKINFMALEYGKKNCKKVKAIVLEGCYGSFDMPYQL